MTISREVVDSTSNGKTGRKLGITVRSEISLHVIIFEEQFPSLCQCRIFIETMSFNTQRFIGISGKRNQSLDQVQVVEHSIFGAVHYKEWNERTDSLATGLRYLVSQICLKFSRVLIVSRVMFPYHSSFSFLGNLVSF